MKVMQGEVETWIDLPAPSPAGTTIDLDKLNNQLRIYTDLINQQLGTNLADENRGNETAMAVLSRNRAKEDARSELLSNLNYSAKQIAKILQDYMALLGQEAMEISVTDQLSQGIRLRQSVDMLLATQQLPPNERVAIMQSLNASPIILEAVTHTAQNQQDPQKQQMQQQIQQLQQQIQQMSLDNQFADAQRDTAIMNARTQYDTAQLSYEREMALAKEKDQRERDKMALDYELKIKQIELEYAKLGLEADKATAKIDSQEAIASAKIAADKAIDYIANESGVE